MHNWDNGRYSLSLPQNNNQSITAIFQFSIVFATAKDVTELSEREVFSASEIRILIDEKTEVQLYVYSSWNRKAKC